MLLSIRWNFPNRTTAVSVWKSCRVKAAMLLRYPLTWTPGKAAHASASTLLQVLDPKPVWGAEVGAGSWRGPLQLHSPVEVV